MGGGLPLTKIANNEIKRLEIDFRPSKVKLLANVLKNNSSLKQVVMSWGLLDEESQQILLNTRGKLFFGSRAVCMCEDGRKEDLKSLIQDHDVEGSEESLRELMNREGMDSNHTIYTPLQVASAYENEAIVKLLLDKCDADVSFKCDKGKTCLHRAAWHTKTNLNTMTMLLDHPETTKEVINLMDDYRETPLDAVYKYNNSEFQENLVSLLRQHGAKANFFNANGDEVREGWGDLEVDPGEDDNDD